MDQIETSLMWQSLNFFILGFTNLCLFTASNDHMEEVADHIVFDLTNIFYGYGVCMNRKVHLNVLLN